MQLRSLLKIQLFCPLHKKRLPIPNSVGRNKKNSRQKSGKRKNELKKTEDRIAVLEERNEEIDMLMTQEEVYSNSVKCQEFALEKDANNNELEELYEKWEELAE